MTWRSRMRRCFCLPPPATSLRFDWTSLPLRAAPRALAAAARLAWFVPLASAWIRPCSAERWLARGSSRRTIESPSSSTPPEIAAASCTGLASSASSGIGVLEHGGELALLAEVADAVPEAGAQPGKLVPADQPAVAVLAVNLEEQQVLESDDVALHPQHLGDVRDLAR